MALKSWHVGRRGFCDWLPGNSRGAGDDRGWMIRDSVNDCRGTHSIMYCRPGDNCPAALFIQSHVVRGRQPWHNLISREKAGTGPGWGTGWDPDYIRLFCCMIPSLFRTDTIWRGACGGHTTLEIGGAERSRPTPATLAAPSALLLPATWGRRWATDYPKYGIMR